MSDIVNQADAFLKYGPLGFSALIFVAVIIALLARGAERRDPTLRLILWIAFAVFCISAVLAFIPQFMRDAKTGMTLAQADEIRAASGQADAAIEKMKTVPVMVSGSCSGGPGGINPDNYGAVAQTANDAISMMSSAKAGLQTALTLAPPKP